MSHFQFLTFIQNILQDKFFEADSVVIRMAIISINSANIKTR